MSEYKNCPPDVDYIEVPGERGPQGVQGPQGLRGPAGPEGKQGPQGLQGIEGCRGPKGDRGPRGEKGDPGRDGRDGAPGPQGPQGLEGPRGCNGKDGRIAFEELLPSHIEMLRGETGPQGPRGERGPKGDQGVAGPRGLIGPQGPSGPNGTQGPKGDPGEPGPMGATGPKGDKGEPGERGGLNHDDGISESTTWNSKTIAEFVLHGKSKFTERRVNQEGVKHTVKGLVKDLVVHGNTITNFVNQETYKNKVLTTGKAEKDLNRQTIHGRLIYRKPESGTGIIVTPQRETQYSVIVKLDVTRGAVMSDMGDKAKVTMVYTDSTTEFVKGDLDQGLNEVAFPVKENKVLESVYLAIEIADPTIEDPHELDPAFTMSNFMILAGDYSQQITPRYFWGTRGVGDKLRDGDTSNKRKLIIEARNKNLINPKENKTDNWIEDASVVAGEPKPIWREAQDGKNVSFLIYCKQEDYVLTLKAKPNMGKHLRAKIVGFSDIPSNGQPADEVYLDLAAREDGGDGKLEEAQRTGIIQHKFHTGSTINVIGLYVGNLSETTEEQTGSAHKEWTIEDLFEELQLEEGETATHYEPYKSSIKEMILPRQINAGETLKWDDAKGVYYIYGKNGQEVEKTEILEESFIPCYDDMTYLYVRNKIPSLITAKFPISVDDETSYKINEWAFEGDEIDHVPDMKNFLKLPNGFFMQWKKVDVTLNKNNPSAGELHFLNAKKIVYVSVTPYGDTGKTDWYSRVIPQIDPRIPGKVQLYLEGNYQSNTQEVHCMVLIISDNRKPSIII